MTSVPGSRAVPRASTRYVVAPSVEGAVKIVVVPGDEEFGRPSGSAGGE